MTTTNLQAAITACSFCATPHTDVGKMFVGPGVYVCDGCVTRFHDLVAEVTTIPADVPRGRDALEAGVRAMPEESYLAGLANHARALGQLERDIATWVRRGLDRGLSWSKLAGALDLGEDEARHRFAREA